MSNEMESAGRQNRNKSKGGRGEAAKETLSLSDWKHMCVSTQQRENGKERGRQRATAQNSKESSFSRSARVVREVEDSPAFFHGCRRQISDATAVKISRLPCSVREKNLRAARTENERPRQSVQVRAEGGGKIMMAQQLDGDRRGFTSPHQE